MAADEYDDHDFDHMCLGPTGERDATQIVLAMVAVTFIATAGVVGVVLLFIFGA